MHTASSMSHRSTTAGGMESCEKRCVCCGAVCGQGVEQVTRAASRGGGGGAAVVVSLTASKSSSVAGARVTNSGRSKRNGSASVPTPRTRNSEKIEAEAEAGGEKCEAGECCCWCATGSFTGGDRRPLEMLERGSTAIVTGRGSKRRVQNSEK